MYIASHPLPAGFKIATVRLSSLKDDSVHAIEQSADLLKRFKVTRMHTPRLVACTRPCTVGSNIIEQVSVCPPRDDYVEVAPGVLFMWTVEDPSNDRRPPDTDPNRPKGGSTSKLHTFHFKSSKPRGDGLIDAFIEGAFKWSRLHPFASALSALSLEPCRDPSCAPACVGKAAICSAIRTARHPLRSAQARSSHHENNSRMASLNPHVSTPNGGEVLLKP